GLSPNRVDQARRVVGVNLDADILGRAVEDAPRVTPRIVGDDRVAIRELICQCGEHPRVGRSTGDRHESWTGSAHLVVEGRAGDLHCVRRRFGLYSIGHGAASLLSGPALDVGLARTSSSCRLSKPAKYDATAKNARLSTKT